ncbi:MAG: Asp/Glu/hydantoin racemase [Acidobacteria bacterium]|nr:Asp/Glu/hydantoin racemase [Acidobacteriota bacterium]
MLTLALLHTSPVIVPPLAKLAAEILPEVNVVNLVDETLLKNTIAAGRLEKSTIRRLTSMAQGAAEAGADVVLVTCSSVGRAAELAAELVDKPVLRIDEAMADEAVALGERIGVVATLPTTLEPTVALIRGRAAKMGLERTIVEKLCVGAFEAVACGNGAEHDRLVAEGLRDLAQQVDVIVLAQASMARVVDALPEEDRTKPILSSPALGLRRARKALGLD